MIGVTIGIGKEWTEVARRAADRMAENTGLECHVIDSWNGKQYEHPGWMKCRILDLFRKERSFLYFDADVWSVKKWNPSALFEGCNRDFTAVPAVDNQFIVDECRRFELPFGGKYICSGMFMFGREHRAIFDYAESLHPNYGSWWDQTAINAALKYTKGVTRLPFKYCAETHGGKYLEHWTGTPASEVINFHFCSCKDRTEQLKQLQDGGITYE